MKVLQTSYVKAVGRDGLEYTVDMRPVQMLSLG